MQVLKRARVIACALGLGFVASSAHAGAPACYPYNSSGYCQYDGKVSRAYMNAYGEVLLYFDTSFNPANAAAVGLSGVTNGSAALYRMSTNADFGKALYASLLSAQARGATVSVQMHSVDGGYLVMDRIWVYE